MSVPQVRRRAWVTGSVLAMAFGFCVLGADSAFAANACPAVRIASIPCDCYEQFLRHHHFPPGTKIYASDRYLVEDGARRAHFSQLTTFVCKGNVLVASDPTRKGVVTFTDRAKISLIKRQSWAAVEPGRAPAWPLRDEIRRHLAYLYETI